jgi:ribosomal protein S12 methylthiotransferase
MSNTSFHIIRLGCASIQADGIKIASLLQKNGLCPSSGIEDAGIIIILTCGFSYKQYNDSIDTIKAISESNKESAKIWIGGCVPAINKNFIQELPFSVDLIFSPRNFETVLDEYIKSQSLLFQTNNTIIYYNHDEVYPVRIINGCTENCAYCVIKKAGGKVLSQPISKLEQEIRNISNEIKCISVTSI